MDIIATGVFTAVVVAMVVRPHRDYRFEKCVKLTKVVIDEYPKILPSLVFDACMKRIS